MADVRAGGAQRVVDAEHVDGQRLLHDGGVAPDQGKLGGDTRIGHHHVEAAERTDRVLDRRLHGLAVGHVADGPVLGPAAPRDVGELLLLEADQREPRTALAEPLGQRRADASRRARDEHAAAIERGTPTHVL